MKLIAILLLLTTQAIAQSVKDTTWATQIIYRTDENRLMVKNVAYITWAGVPYYKLYHTDDRMMVSVVAYERKHPRLAREINPGVQPDAKDTIKCSLVAHTKANKDYVIVSKCKYLVRSINKEGYYVYKTDKGVSVNVFMYYADGIWTAATSSMWQQ